MTSAALERPVATGALEPDRLRAILLVRIAGAAHGLSLASLADELAPLAAHRLTPAQWRTLAAGEVEALAAAGLIERVAGGCVAATPAGVARTAMFLGVKGNLPRAWQHLHEVRLVAKALGLEREAAKRLAALATPDGLRAAIVQRAFGLKIKGAATPSRLRAALAATALERAFGNQIKAGLTGKLGLSAKAGRLLAAQLAGKPRDFGTDARLVAALAAEQVGAARADPASLRLAVLRRYLDREADAAPARRAPAKVTALRPRVVEAPAAGPAPVEATGRPGLAGFAEEVRRHAAACADGWPGNRKAYISHVWQAVRGRRPEWGLSEIEFKCMLAEAHRAGSLSLAHADLKDNSNIRELQDSAVVYKNAVFHFVRVDG
jgi:hypothetical protein